MIITFGEEIGWRGYALPRLQVRYSALKASLILGILWGFWHFSGWLAKIPISVEMPFYVLMLWVMPGSVLLAWIYNNTKSVLITSMAHAASNMAFTFLPIMPKNTGELTTFLIAVALFWISAITVIIIYGPNLSRKSIS